MMLLMIMLYYCAVHRLIFSQDSTSGFGAVLTLAAGGVRGLHVSRRQNKVKLNALTGTIFIFFTRECYHQMFDLYNRLNPSMFENGLRVERGSFSCTYMYNANRNTLSSVPQLLRNIAM